MLAWLALVATALATRPLLPVDETRYLSVAWEMWLRGDWLVPYLNGAPYPDKPPLLFWSILLGWRAVGVNEWWPRAIGPLCALVNGALVVVLARRLWPEHRPVARAAPAFVYVALWAAYATLVLFDLPLTTTVLLALLGVVTARQGRALAGWTLVAIALGAGLLTKGPIALLHVVPVALATPWWGRSSSPSAPRSWLAWYAGLAAAVVGAIAIALAWAIPAAARGGAAYGDAILWHQTAGRVVHAFAHRRPLWWYLPALPLAFFPWSLWPPAWKALRHLVGQTLDAGTRFCLVWIGATLIGLSLISGKQVHYLLPIIPAAALLAARATGDLEGRRRDVVPVALVCVAVAVAILLVGTGTAADRLPLWATHVAAAWATLPLIGAVVLLATRGAAQRAALAATASGLLLFFHLAVVGPGARDLGLAPVGRFAKEMEEAGRPIAYVGRYAGQFHFVGRLRQPFALLQPDSVSGWTAAHPAGLVICVRRGAAAARAAYVHPYLDREVLVFAAADAGGCVR